MVGWTRRFSLALRRCAQAGRKFARASLLPSRHLSEENARRFSNLAAENEILMRSPVVHVRVALDA